MAKRTENILRRNAMDTLMVMVMQAYDSGSGVGGHIATYASAAAMLEAKFNHCFKTRTENYGGDRVSP